MIQSFFTASETWIAVLGHSLWQATLIAVVVGLLLRGLPAKRANARYAVAVGGLVAVVLSAFVTWSVLRLDSGEGANSESATFASSDKVASAGPMSLTQKVPTQYQASESISTTVPSDAKTSSTSSPQHREGRRLLVQGLACLWAIGAVLMLARGIVGQVTVRKWLAESATQPTDITALQQLVSELCTRLGLRRVVQIVVSHRLSVPAVVGFLSPVILIPPAMLTGIPVDQWRIILAHELAHVRRWDAIVNLAQLVIESLLFFNPAVWWISRQIRVEREACCDALAASVCGEPVSVAWALVDVATVAANSGPKFNPQAALAFAEPANEGELTDRVRRLIDPNRAPRSKVSWIGFAVVLLAIAGASVVLSHSADLAVRATAAWMSPKDRVDNLVRLEAERNGNFLPLADAETAGSPPANSADSDAPEKITVEVVVRMEDGSNVSRKLNWGSTYRTGNSTSSSSLSPPREDVPEFRQTLKFPPCQLLFAGSIPGGGGAKTPLLSLFAGDPPRTVEMVIKSGDPVHVAIRNERGESVPHAQLQAGFQADIRGSGSTMGSVQLQADGFGDALMEHVIDARYSIDVQAAGYQRQHLAEAFAQPRSFTREAPFVITMKAARPTFVRVVDANTGEGIEKAKFRIAHVQERNHGHGYGFSRANSNPDIWYDYATTIEEGRAVLDQLRDDATYSFVILAPNYAATLFEITAGQAEQTVKLSHPLQVSGQLTGEMSRLQKRYDGKPGYLFSFNSRIGEHVNDYGNVQVDEEGHFAISGLSRGERLELNLPDVYPTFDLKESVGNLKYVIKPAAGPASFPQRDVVIRLTGVSPEAPARGTLYVSWQHPTVRTSTQNGPLPLRGNEIQLKIPVGAQLNFFEDEVAGYKISRRDQIDIVAGSAPLVIDTPVTVMGGIHGVIKHADGTAADQAFVRVFPIKLPRGIKEDEVNPSSSRGGSEYLREVPLGGRYRILAKEETARGYVWAVSGEIAISEESPITQADIQLPTGRDVAMTILDEAGKPIANQEVELEVSFQLKSSAAGTSSRTTAKSNRSGIVTFYGLSVDQKIEPLTCTLTAMMTPHLYRGETVPISISKPTIVRLKKGSTASGTIIDGASGKPIPGAEVRLVPRHFNQATYKGSVTTTTDSQGQFKLQGLEPMEYTGYVEGTSPKGVVFGTRDGGTSISFPAGVNQHSLTAGATDVRWDVSIHPGSKLKPMD